VLIPRSHPLASVYLPCVSKRAEAEEEEAPITIPLREEKEILEGTR